MELSLKLQDYIKNPKNISLLQEGDFNTLYFKCPTSFRGELLQMLRKASIEVKFNEEPNSLWGLKISSIGGEGKTLSLRAPDENNKYGVNWTSNRGMLGGHQIGFRKLEDALNAIDKFLSPSLIYIYKISKDVVNSYSWEEVESKNIDKIWVTTRAMNSFKRKGK